MSDDEFWDEIFPEQKKEEEVQEEGPRIHLVNASDLMKGGAGLNLSGLGEIGKMIMDGIKKVVVMKTPEYQVMVEITRAGMLYMLESDSLDDAIEAMDNMDDDDEEEIVTKDGISHCALVNASMIETMDDESHDMFDKALIEFKDTGDAKPVLEALHSLMHFQAHVGIAMGIGLYMKENGLLPEEED